MTTITELAESIPPEQIRQAGKDVFAYFFATFNPNADITAIMRGRQQLGLATYGQPLLTDDGRHTLTEIIGEQADTMIYLTKLLMQNRGKEKAEKKIRALITDTYLLMLRTIALARELGEVEA